MKYEIQPIRDFLALCAMAFLGFGWWALGRSTEHPSPLAFMETSLVLIIAAEAYARDT